MAVQPWPFANNPRAKKVMVKFRPATQPNGGIYNNEVYFRENVTPMDGWLVLSNGLTIGKVRVEETDTLMWPVLVIASVRIVAPTPEDECWVCLKTRAEHHFIAQSGPSPAHYFDWTPVGAMRREEVQA